MSTAPVHAGPTAAKAGESSMFDSLARLVPEELQTAYYRVLAHTRTLSPDDEMLRILEAMGILALLTRHTPKDIADERERIQAMLDAHLQFSDEAQGKMLGYVHLLEERLAGLPREIEAGLDPRQIANLLGESLRQNFLQCGVPETVASLQATTAAMGNIQVKLTRAITELSDPYGGVLAQVEGANRRVIQTLEQRITALDSLLHEFKSDLLRIWIPASIIAMLLIGLIGGMGIQGCRDSASTSAISNSAQALSQSKPEMNSVANSQDHHPRSSQSK